MSGTWSIRLLIVVLAGVLLIWSPILFLSFWHLAHGKSVTYKGRQIPVPFGWVLSNTSDSSSSKLAPDEAEFSALPYTVFGFSSRKASITFLSIQSDSPAAEYDRWLRAEKEISGRSGGYQIVGPHPDRFICVRHPLLTDGATLHCFMFGGTLIANYVGRQELAAEALAIISGTT